MAKRRTKQQIKELLAQADAKLAEGARVDEVCEDLGVSMPTYYAWRKKHSGRGGDVDPPKRVKELETENGRLRRVVADQAMEIVRLKEDLGEY
jgi:putative transposase